MITENGHCTLAEASNAAQDAERVRSAIDEVTHEPEATLVIDGVEAVEQSVECGSGTVDVADTESRQDSPQKRRKHTV
jgi:hypothetical protein